MKEADYITQYIEMEKGMLEVVDKGEIQSVLDVMMETYQAGGTIYVFGNGGSATTASHMANDFNKGVSEYVERKFKICCLNDSVATMLSIANDISYEEIYRFQLRGKLQPEDLVIGFSGSGNSANVVHAVSYAKEQGVKTVGFCGFGGGKLKEIADYSFYVPLNNMKVVEDLHLMMNHLLMYAVEKILGITVAC